MNITVKNLGPITVGSIAFDKGLTVLTGPNNMGKSYLGYLIHGIASFNQLTNESHLEQELGKLFSNSKFLREKLEQDSSIHLEELISHHIEQISKIINNTIQDNLVEIFASNTIKAEVQLELNAVNLNYKDEEYQKIGIADGEINATLKNGKFIAAPFKHTLEMIKHDKKIVKKLDNHQNVAFLAALILAFDLTHRPLFGRAFFFPAERTAINLFAKDIIANRANKQTILDSKLISGISEVELARLLIKQNQEAPKYPYAINSYINFVNTFNPKGKESKFAKIADKLEKIITGGNISITEFQQVLFKPDGSQDMLDLHLSSSLVKSLSYVSLYLRYVARKNDLVIIDEPELNLHPTLQVSITKIIAEMVNAGLKVIISTHSDYLIKEINNLVILHDLNKSRKHKSFVKDRGYSASDLIDRNQIGAYYLHKGEIIAIDLDKNGFEVPSINDAIRRVDGLAEELFIETEG